MNTRTAITLACFSFVFLSYQVSATSVQKKSSTNDLASLAETVSVLPYAQNVLHFAKFPNFEPSRLSDSLIRQSGNRKQCEAGTGVLDVITNCSPSCIEKSQCSSSCCMTLLSSKQVVMCENSACCVRMIGYEDGVAVVGEKLSSSGDDQGVCSNSKPKSSCDNCYLLVNSDRTLASCSSYKAPKDNEDVSGEKLCATSSSSSSDDGADSTPDGGTTEGFGGGTGESGGGSGGSTTSGSKSPATTPNPLPAPGKDSCFPSTASVKLESGERKLMSELKLGDRVQVGPATFSDIFAFTHRVSDVLTEFYAIETESGHALSISSGHYLHTVDGLVTAGSVNIGQELLLGSGAVTTVVTKKVEILKGLYNPQTLDGSIVVDGILASTYTTAVSPEIAHFSLALLRAAYKWFGVSTSLLDSGAETLAKFSPRGLETF